MCTCRARVAGPLSPGVSAFVGAAWRPVPRNGVRAMCEVGEVPRFADFEALASAVQAIRGDPLEADAGNIVHYRGNPKARLMVVGEGPGEQEDRERKPFVGRSGQLLDRILRSVEIDPEADVYITNAVKRRPLNNRNPTPDEVAWYLPYLEEEVRLVDPWIVVVSGRTALSAVLPEADSRITKVRGEWFSKWERLVMPVYHPSFLLRNPRWEPDSPKAQMWKDMCTIRRKLDELAEGSAGTA